MTYSKQEQTKNDFNKQKTTYIDLKLHKTNKKWPEITKKGQETTFSDLQQIDSNFIETLYLTNNKLEGIISITKKE